MPEQGQTGQPSVPAFRIQPIERHCLTAIRAIASDSIRSETRLPQETIAVTMLLGPETASEISSLRRRPATVSAADLTKVFAFAERFGLRVARYRRLSRSIELLGSANDFERAFGISLRLYDSPCGTYRSYDGALSVPADIAATIRGVFGLDNRPLCHPLHQLSPSAMEPQPLSAIEHIAARYRFPSSLSGKGECVGILAFGGGVSSSDLHRFVDHHIQNRPSIRLKAITSPNLPHLDSRQDLETALDIQLVAGLAHGCHIVVYFASNDERGWVNALLRVIHDEDRPTILSISWGATEDWWSVGTIETLNQLFEEAALSGITICVASGDSGCAQDLRGHCRVNFPASSPFVLSCGGTAADVKGPEVVWNVRNEAASGGGISDLIPRPAWQKPFAAVTHFPLPGRRQPQFDGRQVPDVAGLASRSCSVYAGGRYYNGIGGTSAAAPIWSALLARLNQAMRNRGRPRVGFLSPRIYVDRWLQQSLRQVTSGHNDPFGRNGYHAQKGWNPCTGWGTPDGEQLLEALTSAR